jgi:hypothetical protein
MSVKQAALAHVNRLFGLVNAEVANKAELEVLRSRYGGLLNHGYSPSVLPPGAADYLRPDNVRLLDLRARYRNVNLPMIEHSKWNAELVASDIELPYFRGDNAYIFQHRDFNTDSDYVLTAYCLKSIDRLGLFDRLQEDELFGVYALPFNDAGLVSRDLLDSISEITFLEESLGLSRLDKLRVLDIGAGYGRFAYRLTTAFPQTVQAFCVDAVAESTFLSEYYLRFRQVDDRARVIPLDEIQRTLAVQPIDLVTNIHSFSECTLATVRGWLDLVRQHEVRRLLIIPNAEDNGGTRLITLERDGRRIDYRPEIEKRGYRLKCTRPKFTAASVQKHGISPTHYYLFELA